MAIVTTGEWAVVTKNITENENKQLNTPKAKTKGNQNNKRSRKYFTSQIRNVLACLYTVHIVLNINALPTQIWIVLKPHFLHEHVFSNPKRKEKLKCQKKK